MQGLTIACYSEIIAAGSPECQCVCEREREREREKFLRSLRARPPSILPLKPSLPSPSSRQPTLLYANTQHCCRCQVSSAEWRNGAFELRPETEEAHVPANQDVTDCLPKLFEQSIVAVSVNEKKKFFLRFFKKSGKSFFKKRKVKKKKKAEFHRKAED